MKTGNSLPPSNIVSPYSPSDRSYQSSTSLPDKPYSKITTYFTYYVASNSINVHLGPSIEYTISGALSYAEHVEVIESYSSGWKKIQYRALNRENYLFEDKIGYVSGTYLSTSLPYFNDSNTTDSDASSGNSYTHSTIYKSSNSYSHERGSLTIWTNCSTDGEIKIYIDGLYEGKLTQYFTDELPTCGEAGTLVLNKPPGTYRMEAKGNKNVWSGMLIVNKDNCLIQKLEK